MERIINYLIVSVIGAMGVYSYHLFVSCDESMHYKADTMMSCAIYYMIGNMAIFNKGSVSSMYGYFKLINIMFNGLIRLIVNIIVCWVFSRTVIVIAIIHTINLIGKGNRKNGSVKEMMTKNKFR